MTAADRRPDSPPAARPDDACARAPASLHVVSDSTGETGYAVAKAAMARFDGPAPPLNVSVFVRSDADLDAAIARIEAAPGPVLHTLANGAHRDRLEAAAAALGIETTGLLDGALGVIGRALGQPARDEPGLQHRVNDRYFERIAALDFAIAHDDGALGERLRAADVILAGVSRTSKTPTCIYLAYRGIRAANLPLVPGRPVDAAFEAALGAGVLAVGLTASPARLEQVRRIRLDALGDRAPDYADPERIRAEVADARLFFERHAMPVIDVTRRSIEETAAAVQALLRTAESVRAADPSSPGARG